MKRDALLGMVFGGWWRLWVEAVAARSPIGRVGGTSLLYPCDGDHR